MSKYNRRFLVDDPLNSNQPRNAERAIARYAIYRMIAARSRNSSVYIRAYRGTGDGVGRGMLYFHNVCFQPLTQTVHIHRVCIDVR